CLHVRDRNGQMRSLPLMGLSVAIVNTPARPVHTIHELIATAFEIKKFLKKQPNSNYLVDRRSDDKGITNRQDLNASYEEKIKAHHLRSRHALPLGQKMIACALITEEQLNEALSHHWQSGQRLGESAVTLGFATRAEIDRLLETKQSDIPHTSLS
ncbi:MAG: hypothetical protein ACM3L6_06415, partial [Deltaproteobacteria bacterium]